MLTPIPSLCDVETTSKNDAGPQPRSGLDSARHVDTLHDCGAGPWMDCATISDGMPDQAALQEPKKFDHVPPNPKDLSSYAAPPAEVFSAQSLKQPYTLSPGGMNRPQEAYRENQGSNVGGGDSQGVSNVLSWKKIFPFKKKRGEADAIASQLEAHFMEGDSTGIKFPTKDVKVIFSNMAPERRLAISQCITDYATSKDKNYIKELKILVAALNKVGEQHWCDLITLLQCIASRVEGTKVLDLTRFIRNLATLVVKESINILDYTAKCIQAADEFGVKETSTQVKLFDIGKLAESIAKVNPYDWDDVLDYVRQIAGRFRGNITYGDWAEAIEYINYVLPKYRASLLQVTADIAQKKLTEAESLSASAEIHIMGALATYIKPHEKLACFSLDGWLEGTKKWNANACGDAIARASKGRETAKEVVYPRSLILN